MQQGDGSSSALRPVALVLADIGGYTRFMRLHAVSVVHAEAIVTEPLEAVIDRAEHPLRLNKLEGDAAFLYAEVQAGPETLRGVLAQVRAFGEAFAARRAELAEYREGG
jgi:Protein of unknown function (DUF2652)